MRRITVLCALAAGAAGLAGTAVLTGSLPVPDAPDLAAGSLPAPTAGTRLASPSRSPGSAGESPGAALKPAPDSVTRPYERRRDGEERRSLTPGKRFDKAALDRTVRGYLRTRPGEAAVMVRDLRTGLSFRTAWRRDEYVTASMIKVDILAALLLQRQRDRDGPRGDDGGISGRSGTGGRGAAGTSDLLSSDEERLAEDMIKVSDNNAADALYAKIGHEEGLRRLNRALGLTRTSPYGAAWGASRTTPADQVRLLGALTDPRSRLSVANRRYVLGLMYGVVGEQRWGISAAARPGERVAIKNGWVPLETHGHGWAINSMGRITGPRHDFLIAVCSQSHPTMESGRATVEHLARTTVTAMRNAAS